MCSQGSETLSSELGTEAYVKFGKSRLVGEQVVLTNPALHRRFEICRDTQGSEKRKRAGNVILESAAAESNQDWTAVEPNAAVVAVEKDAARPDDGSKKNKKRKKGSWHKNAPPAPDAQAQKNSEEHKGRHQPKKKNRNSKRAGNPAQTSGSRVTSGTRHN